jgi:hypothetical protein
MKKYGSLFFVAAMVISSVAHADIPIVHQQGSDLQKEAKNHPVRERDADKDKDAKPVCPGGEAALEHCEVNVGCNLVCLKPAVPAAPEASNAKVTNRKTANVKNTDSAE